MNSLSLTPLERLMLDLIRHLCAGFAANDVRPWDKAYGLAEARMGLVDGPSIVARAVSLMRAVRAERLAPFHYLSADCPGCSAHVSPCEGEIMRLLQLARRGGPDDLGERACAFAKRHDAPAIQLALRATTELFARYERAMLSGQARNPGGTGRLH